MKYSRSFIASKPGSCQPASCRRFDCIYYKSSDKLNKIENHLAYIIMALNSKQNYTQTIARFKIRNGVKTSITVIWKTSYKRYI